jgi:hypothetical protein
VLSDQQQAFSVRVMLDVRAPARRSVARPLGIWGALIVIAVVWGRVLVARGAHLDIAAPPFWSRFEVHVTWHVIPAVGVAAAIVQWGPAVARSSSWRRLLAWVAGATTVWTLSVAYIDNIHGIDALTDPVRLDRYDYLQTAHEITSLHAFLARFSDVLAVYPQNTKGHPPGMVVIEWVLLKLGLTSAPLNAVLVVAGGVAASVAVLVALRDVAGEDAARVAAPFLVLLPAVIWWQTADAFFAGVAAWAVTLVVLASNRRDRVGDVDAIMGGLLFGVTAFLSYGLVLLALIPAVVCVARRRARPLVLAAIATLPVVAWFASMGFSWFAGLAATRHVYWTGVAIHRPYSYFFVADLAVFAVATGPAVAVALARLRDRRVWLLAGSALAIVALADVSGMSKGEVERIWLPFVPWVVVAAAALGERRSLERVRPFLWLQVACTMVVGVTIWSQW